MTEMKNQRQCGTRQRTVLTFLARYGGMPPIVAERLLADQTPDARRKLLERMCSQDLLVRHPFPGNAGHYWVLSEKAARQLGLRRRETAFKQGSLLRMLLTVLFFEVHGGTLLTVEECRTVCPWLLGKSRASSYFVFKPADSEPVIGRLLLDVGRTPLRLVTKLRSLAVRAKAHDVLRELAATERFRLAVATTTPAKQQKIESLLKAHPIRGVPVDIVPAGLGYETLFLGS